MNLLEDDIDHVLRRLPAHIREELRAAGEGVWLAGGFIRAVIAHEPLTDVDLFISKSHDPMRTIKKFANTDAEMVHVTDRAHTALLEQQTRMQMVQVVHGWRFDTPQNVLSEFDFSVIQAALWYAGGWQSAVGDSFYADLAGRRIRYMQTGKNRSSDEAGGTLQRLIKYTKRGYHASPETIAEVVSDFVACAQLDGLPDAERYAYIINILRGLDPAPNFE